jgi:hypothetical protein
MKFSMSINFSWLAGLLTVLFIVLKLANYIAWSWLWVLSPLWIGLLISLIITFLFWIFIKDLPK